MFFAAISIDAAACSPDPTIREAALADGEAMPGGVVRAMSPAGVPSAILTAQTDDREIDLDSWATDRAPQYWSAFKLPDDLDDGLYDLTFASETEGEVVFGTLDVAADRDLGVVDVGVSLQSLSVERRNATGWVCDTGTDEVFWWVDMAWKLPQPPTNGWIAEVADVATGEVVAWYVLDRGVSTGESWWVTPADARVDLCLEARLRGPTDDVAWRSEPQCVATPSAPEDEGEEAAATCGCDASSAPAVGLLGLAAALRRRDRRTPPPPGSRRSTRDGRGDPLARSSPD